jgi:hypothetical protein
MKKFIATSVWLMAASASMGEAGQHTGVGGNPWVPPPAPNTIDIPNIVMQTLALPGAIIVLPVQALPENEDAGSGENPEGDEGDQADK